MTLDRAAVEDRLEELAALVSADGGALQLEEAGTDGRVRLRLVLDDVDCADCVLPRSYLEDISADILRRTGLPVTAVVIDDPREAPVDAEPEP